MDTTNAAITDSLKTFFNDYREEVAAAYLFGSIARGTAKPGSDVDVAVLFSGEHQPSLLGPETRLRGELERRLGRGVDLIALNRAPPDLIHRVLRDGILLAVHDASARVRFEVDARNRYFDLLPHLKRYREGVRT